VPGNSSVFVKSSLGAGRCVPRALGAATPDLDSSGLRERHPLDAP
jgi:hypothetical protein